MARISSAAYFDPINGVGKKENILDSLFLCFTIDLYFPIIDYLRFNTVRYSFQNFDLKLFVENVRGILLFVSEIVFFLFPFGKN